MLKLISSSSARHFHRHFSSSSLRFTTAESSASHSLNALSSIICLATQKPANPSITRTASFCSDSPSNSEEEKLKSAADSSDSSNATSHTVLVFPFLNRPLFPGFGKQLIVQDPMVLQSLHDLKHQGWKDVYCGTFLIKDDVGNDPRVWKCSETGELRGRAAKDLYPRHLHKVGTLFKITNISDLELPLILGLKRVRIIKMVSGFPFVVKVNVLEDEPYVDDDAMKATSAEVMSTLRDVMKINDFKSRHRDLMAMHSGEFNYSKLADFGAAMSGASKLQCQEVLEELDVHRRLKLTLQLLKKDLEISKLQESVRKGVEEKIRSGWNQ